MNAAILAVVLFGGVALLATAKKRGTTGKTTPGGTTPPAPSPSGSGSGSGSSGSSGSGSGSDSRRESGSKGGSGSGVPGTKAPGGEYIPADLPEMTASRGFTENDAARAIHAVALTWGREIAQALEKTWRQETTHWRSGEYQSTGGAGWHPWEPTFPWYWGDLKKFWSENPECRPIGYYWKKEGQSGTRRVYLAFKSPITFAMSFAALVRARKKRYNINALEAAATYFGRYGTDNWKKRVEDLKKMRVKYA